MNSTDFNKIIAGIRSDSDISKILARTAQLAADFGRKDLADALKAMQQRRFFMLRTIMQGHDVPGFSAETQAAALLVLGVVGALQHMLLAAEATSAFGIQTRFQQLRPEENLESLFTDYLAEAERLGTDTAAFTDSRSRGSLERISADIFKNIWVCPPLENDREHFILSILTDTGISPDDRRMWTAAVGLGNIPFTDSRRFDILLKVYQQTESALSACALCWLCITLMWADKLPVHYPVENYLNKIAPEDAALFLQECFRIDTSIKTSNNLALMQSQMWKTYQDAFGDSLKDGKVDMDEIRKKMEENGGPELNSDQFDFMKRLDAESREGFDVFFNTFRPLRAFPFFNEISNWFRPFRTDASELAEITDGGGVLLADTIGRVPVLPDSDKYAIILSLAQTPENMRAQALDAITARFYSVMDSPEFDENLKRDTSRRALINSCLKDMFRFFLLCPMRYGKNGFKLEEIIYDGNFKRLVAETPSVAPVMAAIADLFIRIDDPYNAATYYKYARANAPLSPAQERNYVVSAAVAQTDDAINLLQEYLTDNPDDAEILLSAAKLLQELKRPAEAQTYLDHLLQLEPENLDALETLAVVYSDQGMWDKETEIRYQIDYLTEGDNMLNSRMLARCLERNGELDEAIAVYASIPHEKIRQTDQLKFGLLLWFSGKRNQAVDYLMLTAKEHVLDADGLVKATLIAYGLLAGNYSSEDLDLLCEVLSLSMTDSEFGRLL